MVVWFSPLVCLVTRIGLAASKLITFYVAFYFLDVPVDKAHITISIRNIKGVKMPEEIEVNIL